MSYVVKYRSTGALFWKKIANVKADLNLMKENLAVRVLILEDESRLEIPALTHEFCFSKERFTQILKSQEREIGQKIAIDTKSS